MRVFRDALSRSFKGEIRDDEATLLRYSTDASLFEVRPSLVVAPKNVDDVKALVKSTLKAREAGEKISLTARAAGTDMTGGPLTESVVVSFTEHLNRIRSLAGNRVVAEPGVYYRDLEKETLKSGFLFPSYPASRELCALGGIIGNNAGGEKSLTFGKTERYVERLTAVLADGNEYSFEKIPLHKARQKAEEATFEGKLYRKMLELIERNENLIGRAKPNVTKNSAGYALWNVLDRKAGTFDLTKLFVGSQGTLGLITSATLSLVRPKSHSRMLVLFLKDLSLLGELVPAVLHYKPESFESYDDRTFEVAIRYFSDIAKRLRGNIFTLAFRFLPEFLTMLRSGMPKLVLIAEFTGESDEEAESKALAALRGLARFNLPGRITRSAEESEKYWIIRRESFNLLRHHTHGKRTAPFIDDIVVQPHDLPTFLPKLYAILDQYEITYTIAGHAGDANFHIIPLMDLTKPEAVRVIRELSEKVFELVFSYKGSLTGEHNDGLIRTPYLKEMYGEDIYRLFEEVKKIFDPENVFNPGKKVGGTLQYALSHLNRQPAK